MPERWVNKTLLLTVLIFIVIRPPQVLAQKSSALLGVHPQAKAYCSELTLNKRILIAHYLSGGFSASMKRDLSVYDQKRCEHVISRLITTEDEIKLSASSSIFDEFQEDLPQDKRIFDYRFICAATKITSLTLSAAKDWSVLECLKNPQHIATLHLANFVAPLNLQFLKQFSNLQFLSLTHGQTTNDAYLTQLASLKSLTLNNLKLSAKAFAQIGKLTNLESLRLQRISPVDVSHFSQMKNLQSLELVYLPIDALRLNGLEKMTALITLNLQGSHINDGVYTKVVKLPNLTRLNLSDNNGITTVAPLSQLPNLKQLNIGSTAVSELGPLATHPSLFGHQYDIGYSVQYGKSKIIDLTGYYENGGNNSESAHLLRCSPTSKAEYDSGKRCNDQQRKHCQPADTGFIDHFIKAPLCVWWFGD